MGCSVQCPTLQDRPWPPGEGFVEDEMQLRCSFLCDSDSEAQVSLGDQCMCVCIMPGNKDYTLLSSVELSARDYSSYSNDVECGRPCN